MVGISFVMEYQCKDNNKKNVELNSDCVLNTLESSSNGCPGFVGSSFFGSAEYPKNLRKHIEMLNEVIIIKFIYGGYGLTLPCSMEWKLSLKLCSLTAVVLVPTTGLSLSNPAN